MSLPIDKESEIDEIKPEMNKRPIRPAKLKVTEDPVFTQPDVPNGRTSRVKPGVKEIELPSPLKADEEESDVFAEKDEVTAKELDEQQPEPLKPPEHETIVVPPKAEESAPIKPSELTKNLIVPPSTVSKMTQDSKPKLKVMDTKLSAKVENPTVNTTDSSKKNKREIKAVLKQKIKTEKIIQQTSRNKENRHKKPKLKVDVVEVKR